MIKHIVCFKLKNFADAEEAKNVLLSMKGNVPLLRGIDVHVDELRSDRSYDVILEVLLDDFDALEAYQNDPYHVSVVKKHMHAVRMASVAMDFTL